MLEIRGIADLREVARMFRDADAETRKAIRTEARAWAPTLIRAARARAPGRVEAAIADSGRTTVVANGVKATFGASGRLSSGEPLREVTRPYEFGTYRQNRYVEHRGRSPLNRYYRVRRRTMRQIPAMDPDGRFIYAALAATTPDLVSRWVKATVKAVTYA